MKNLLYNLSLFTVVCILFSSCVKKKEVITKIPINYIVVLDLSDRILVPGQLIKDFHLIEQYFTAFEKKARQNLVLNSKDRFSVKIIPQNSSPLNVEHYEDLLQVHLDEIEIKDKHKALNTMAQSLHKVLENLEKDAVYSPTSKAYFGVDIWAYMHDNGNSLSKAGFKNTVLMLTDGYFDFGSQIHMIQDKNQNTSTRFLNELTTSNWKQISDSKEYGLLPILLEENTKWIVAGISGKKATDILQTEKITYFWKKWLKQSGVVTSQFILNGSKIYISSFLLEKIK